MNPNKQPSKPNPDFDKKDARDKRRAELLAIKNDSEAAPVTEPTYEILRGGSELQRKLAERLNKALQNDERFLQIGEAEPDEEQVEVVPESKVNEAFFKSLPESREFVVYANAQDLAVPAESLRPAIGKNVLIVFDSAYRLIDELSYNQEPDAQEAA